MIGRHPECGRYSIHCHAASLASYAGFFFFFFLSAYLQNSERLTDIVVDDPIVSNRHCLIFAEHKGNDTVVILEDLSSNGTFVNEAIVGRNQRRELLEQDEIAVKDTARFIFRYPKYRQTSAFSQQYTLLGKLGKGHFAEVFACVEKSTGQRYAVKIFSMVPGLEERSRTEGLQLEIAVLMGVSHPNVLCLKDTFHEGNAVYLVLELAPEGELFNFIVMKQKLSEAESRKLFTQLFHGVKYLVCLSHYSTLKNLQHSDTDSSVLWLQSMTETLSTAISNRRTSCWLTRICTSKLPILGLPKLSARSPSRRLCVARLATSHPKFSLMAGIASTRKLLTYGRWALCFTSACADFRRSPTS